MITAGIDIGSSTSKAVIFEENNILSYSIIPTTADSAGSAQRAMDAALNKVNSLSERDTRWIVATGCGRGSVPFANRQSTEVVCQARGGYYLLPSTRTVINLGAESSRAIKMTENGKVEGFTKNDKCAAGSGLFLETMSTLLEVPVELMGELSLKADDSEEVSSICAVFAESEIISHIHRGVPKDRILAGLHQAVAGKILEMLGTMGLKSDVTVTGGVAKNVAIIRELEQRVGLKIIVLPEPQIVGALGAALLARDRLAQH